MNVANENDVRSVLQTHKTLIEALFTFSFTIWAAQRHAI
jgi:hypothetical protein